MVAPMAVRSAGAAFLFDVIHISVCREVEIPADHATTAEGRESEEPNEASHTSLRAPVEQ
jgi:hypothetical protein